MGALWAGLRAVDKQKPFEESRSDPGSPLVRRGTAPDCALISEDCRRVHFCASNALGAVGLTAADAILVLYAHDAEKRRAHVRHFQIGQFKEMADAAMSWSLAGLNVYRSLAAYRRVLSISRRGCNEDIVAVFGLAADLDADKGNQFRVEDLPLHPSSVALTSQMPVVNRQASYLLSRALLLPEAKAIAAKLCAVVGDADGGTGDPGHVWRIPGTLNMPTPTKLARGRPAQPQLIVVDGEARGTGKPVDPNELLGALDVALETAIPRSPAEDKSACTEGPECLHCPDQWNGEPLELNRYRDALRSIPAHDRETWLKVGMALHDYGAGSGWSFDLWTAWSKGDITLGYAGSAKYDAADQHRTWKSFSFSRKRPVRIGSIVQLAQLNGWDAGRLRFGLSTRTSREAKAGRERDAVEAAGRDMVRSCNARLAREAWFRKVVAKCKGKRRVCVALAIKETVDVKTGLSTITFDELRRRTVPDVSQTKLKRATEKIREAVRELAADKFIAKTDGRSGVELGRRRPLFALLPPDGLTWQQLIEQYSDSIANPDTPESGGIYTLPSGGIDTPHAGGMRTEDDEAKKASVAAISGRAEEGRWRPFQLGDWLAETGPYALPPEVLTLLRDQRQELAQAVMQVVQELNELRRTCSTEVIHRHRLSRAMTYAGIDPLGVTPAETELAKSKSMLIRLSTAIRQHTIWASADGRGPQVQKNRGR